MSSSIKNNVITLTRGDTLKALVSIKLNGQPYEPVEGDKIQFALKNSTLTADGREYTDVRPLILKDIPIDTMVLELKPEDTKGLGFGKYVYDVQITFTDGVVDTFIPATPFILAREVG